MTAMEPHHDTRQGGGVERLLLVIAGHRWSSHGLAAKVSAAQSVQSLPGVETRLLMQHRLVNRAVLVMVLCVISALFFWLVKPFFLPVLLAGLFAALFTPLNRRILKRVGGRESVAAMLTLLLVLCFVFVPLVLLAAAVLAQAVDVAQSVVPWVNTHLTSPGLITEKLKSLPFFETVLPYRDMLMQRVGDLAGVASSWALGFAQSITRNTVAAILSGIITLYTMFFFLREGDRLLYYMLYYLPLNDEDEQKLLARFTSVTRATIKGTAVIGFLQGTLAGAALWLAGVPSALFWSVVMMLLSVVPGVGTMVVWIPAVIYLVISGQVMAAVLVGLFCGIVVGTLDNLLRPKLVGNDTQLHELLIFFSTLGGLLVFGFWGFVIGPIIAALFVTIWELYGDEFHDYLPYTAFRPTSGQSGSQVDEPDVKSNDS